MAKPKPINNLIAPYMAALDRQEAIQRERALTEVQEVQREHAKDVTKARAILAELTAFEQEYGEMLGTLLARDWRQLPQAPAVVNQISQVERLVMNATQTLTSNRSALSRVISEIESLSNERLGLFSSYSTRWYIKNAGNAPAALRREMPMIIRAVETLAQLSEQAQGEEVSVLVALPPAPEPLTVETGFAV